MPTPRAATGPTGSAPARTAPDVRPIVVGIDGSQGAAEALRWALVEAQHRKAGVRAVMAWGYPAAFGLDETAYVMDSEALEAGAVAMLRTAVEDALAAAQRSPDAPKGIEIEQVVVRGSAADVLVEESRSADLLVVGARGRGGFLGLRLGSVSSHVTHCAHCPVVVVRNDP
jgi:nucleotide-binding universal stress UspA family protein